MKKFVINISILALITSVLIGGYCAFANFASTKYYGLNTSGQIHMSFKNALADDYSCYFLGNSRIYRDINPDKFVGVKSYNFGHDNDSYNQMYYKLMYLLENDKQIDTLIIGTDYFAFSFLSDSRNYIYGDLFPHEYMDDFENAGNRINQFGNKMSILWKNKQNALPAVEDYVRRKHPPENLNYQKENGQYIAYGQATGDETVDREYNILDVLYSYYDKIIGVCQEEEIDLWIIMPPLWEAETRGHTDEERREFDEMIENSLKGTPFENHYINYTTIEGLASYEDFIDVTHLSAEAADRYSEYINEKIFDK